MRFSRFHLPPGHSFGRRPADDDPPHDHRRPGALSRPAEPAAGARAPVEPRRSSPPGEPGERPPAAGSAPHGSAPASDDPSAGGGWRTVGGGLGGQSLIDQLAAEAEEARPAEPWPDDPAPPAPDPAAAAQAEAAPDRAQDGLPEDLDDIAVTIGRVVSIRGSVVWGALFDNDDGTAGRAARMGALVSMRGPDSRVFGIVNALERDGGGGGQQAERTIFEIQVLGESRPRPRRARPRASNAASRATRRWTRRSPR
jgi:hypothetical protein